MIHHWTCQHEQQALASVLRDVVEGGGKLAECLDSLKRKASEREAREEMALNLELSFSALLVQAHRQ